MFYKYINEDTIKIAPNPLVVNDTHIFTNSEEIYNENGYYRLVQTEYPDDEKYYEIQYVLEDNIIRQVWVESKEIEQDTIDQKQSYR